MESFKKRWIEILIVLILALWLFPFLPGFYLLDASIYSVNPFIAIWSSFQGLWEVVVLAEAILKPPISDVTSTLALFVFDLFSILEFIGLIIGIYFLLFVFIPLLYHKVTRMKK